METETKIINWDDGHRPGSTSQETKMAINLNKAADSFFLVFDNFLRNELCDLIYEYALRRGRPWGAYITTHDAFDPTISSDELWDSDPERAISLEVVRTYFNNKHAVCLREDRDRIHGCAVWCLSSGTTNQVEYHIDYAELYRYETNVIHPPLYAGTCQISSLHGNELIGGDFYANSRGLDHYKEFGYKAMMKSKDELDMDIQSDDWIKIRYKRNRGTLHDGDFPHFSSPIQFIAPGKKRVILGLNFFSASVGECCIRAPEHSDAFNRTVKLYQMMSKLGSEFGTAPGGKYSNSTPEELPDKEKENPTEKPEASKEPNSAKKGFSAKDIAKNPAMARMFILAAKKMKEIKIREASSSSPDTSENRVEST